MGILDASFRKMREDQDKSRQKKASHSAKMDLKDSAAQDVMHLSHPKQTAPTKGTGPKLLLVDDDPIFCRIMESAAKKEGHDIVVCTEIDDLAKVQDQKWDAAIIDYDLEIIDGLELTKYLEVGQKNLPVVIVSQTERVADEKWPSSIQNFLSKKMGPKAILDEAFKYCPPQHTKISK